MPGVEDLKRIAKVEFAEGYVERSPFPPDVVGGFRGFMEFVKKKLKDKNP